METSINIKKIRAKSSSDSKYNAISIFRKQMKVLKNAFKLLELFLNNNSELILEKLASLSGLNKSNISRIMADLTEHGYIIQREKRGKY